MGADLITQLTKRLGKLEKAQFMHRDEMVRKDREILKLKRRIMALESVTEGKQAAVRDVGLAARCARVFHPVSSRSDVMVAFLHMPRGGGTRCRKWRTSDQRTHN